MSSISHIVQKRTHHLTVIQRNSLILLAIWVLSMVSLPILRWIFGDDIIPMGVMLGVITQVIAVAYIVSMAWGIHRTIFILLAIAVMAWIAEVIGSSTGFPFGEYTYTDRLQPQLLHVPIIVPLAWFMMLPSAWAVAQIITRPIQNQHSRKIAFVLISALAFTAWDLFLDPQMVAWGFWTWHYPSGYFGIPFINFIGWIAVAMLATMIIRPKNLPELPLLTVYGIIWFLQSFGLFFFWGQPAPAIIGCIGMGIFLASAIYRLRGQL